jgi:hypothetical protein
LVRSWSHALAASIGMTVIVIVAVITAAITPFRQALADDVSRLSMDREMSDGKVSSRIGGN